MVKSLKMTHGRQKDLEEQVKRVWIELADSCIPPIPESLVKFARAVHWLPKNAGWRLPEFLMLVTDCTLGGGGSSYHIFVHETEFKVYGFESCAQAKRAFRELEQAWNYIIKVVCINNPNSDGIIVFFHANEFLPLSKRRRPN